MGFQIKDKEGKPLSLQQLDEEAAAFWGKDLDLRKYATPEKITPGMSEMDIAFTNSRGNWFDIIGWHIHSPQNNYTSGWNNIKNSIWLVCASGLLLDYKDSELMLAIVGIKLYLDPYYKLIDHWSGKGYTPEKIGD